MNKRPRLRAFAVVLALAVAVIGAVVPPAAHAQNEPALPPPPLTVQDVVNELLPVIRQLDPLMAQLGPVVSAVSKPLLAGGSASADQVAKFAVLLEPLVSLGAPAADAVAGLLAPVADQVDQEISPQLAELLGALGPYLNQVDLATAFQVIGPLAPTAVQAIPTLNKYYDAIDVIGPLRDPFTCPIARAVPSQQILDIVTPFLCYSTIRDGDLPTGGEETGTGFGTTPPPTDGTMSSPTAEAPSVPSGSVPELVAAPSLPSSPGGTKPQLNSVGAPGLAPPLQPPAPVAVVSSEDDRVELLEARMRLMFLLLSGLAAMLWNFFRAPDDDGEAGLGSFRRTRIGAPPSLT